MNEVFFVLVVFASLFIAIMIGYGLGLCDGFKRGCEEGYANHKND